MINLKAQETKTLVAVHGWAGAVLGLLLYAVIVTGTAAVFANEIKAWSGGLLGTSEPMSQPLNSVLERLEAETPEAFRGDLSLRTTPAGNLLAFFHADEMVDGARRERGIVYTMGLTAGSSPVRKVRPRTSRPTIPTPRSDASMSTCMCGCVCQIPGA